MPNSEHCDKQSKVKEYRLLLDGIWVNGDGPPIDLIDPSNGQQIATVGTADGAQIAAAVGAAGKAQRGFAALPAIERSRMLHSTAQFLEERTEQFAFQISLEQGKPLAEAIAEVQASIELLQWFAEEGRRNYGRLIPARHVGVRQTVLREPIGPVAAFTPWNFPLSQLVRKIGPAFAVGCTMVLKPAEETLGPAIMLAEALIESGLPSGALNMVFGDPATISTSLVSAPTIRKISFTGSIPIGKHLAALAGTHMKRATMELGGHAPAIITADANIDEACKVLTAAKFRNAGQVCVSPTRFLVERSAYDAVCEKFVSHAKELRLGPGLEERTEMGPLAHHRRVEAVEALVTDALENNGTLLCGGERSGNEGFFFQPTVIGEANESMRAMNEEPFGPIALLRRVDDLDEAISEANRLPHALAAYGFTGSAASAARLEREVEAGMVTVNHNGLALAETPFGGIKDSGYGSEGGVEALLDYSAPKFTSVSTADL